MENLKYLKSVSPQRVKSNPIPQKEVTRMGVLLSSISSRFSRNKPALLPRMNGRERAEEIEPEYLPAWRESVVH